MVLSVVASFLLGGVWLRFFRKIDSFEPESWKATFLCLFLGAVSPVFLEPLVGLYPFLKSLNEKSTGVALLQFALFRVAALEELVKILPFFLLLWSTSWINESVDYIKYPALSALGFATIENVLYSTNYGVDVLHIRGVLAVSAHLFFTSLPGYFMWVSRSDSFPARLLYTVFGYATGVVCHGFYDYFLFEDQNSGTFLGILSVLLCVGFMFFFKRMLIHSIHQSHFYNPKVLHLVVSSAKSLFAGLAAIFIIIGLWKGMGGGNLMLTLAYWKENVLLASIGSVALYGLLAFDRKDIQRE